MLDKMISGNALKFDLCLCITGSVSHVIVRRQWIVKGLKIKYSLI